MDKIVLSSDAYSDINQIVVFITLESKSKEIAISYLDKLETAILSLGMFPQRGSNPRYKILKNQGFKFLIVENHLVFYKINEEKKLVIVYRIVHQKNSYHNFL
ncbi:MAG: type II toxin-antitoxin system RelE/ParE family toxin [Acholeplasmataceae bacterium]|jgi:toxin ParE1/3/4|nr:type II toxin-antitoxin system RelE/ParE family toxin [Erysipelotrichia bacterium]